MSEIEKAHAICKAHAELSEIIGKKTVLRLSFGGKVGYQRFVAVAPEDAVWNGGALPVKAGDWVEKDGHKTLGVLADDQKADLAAMGVQSTFLGYIQNAGHIQLGSIHAETNGRGVSFRHTVDSRFSSPGKSRSGYVSVAECYAAALAAAKANPMWGNVAMDVVETIPV